jgi:hypothetical protein
MKDNSFHNDENWKDILSDKFDSEEFSAPDQAWNQIENELFTKKKHRFAAFLIIMAALFISGSMFLFFKSGEEEKNNHSTVYCKKRPQRQRINVRENEQIKGGEKREKRTGESEIKNNQDQKTTNGKSVNSQRNKSDFSQPINAINKKKSKNHKENSVISSEISNQPVYNNSSINLFTQEEQTQGNQGVLIVNNKNKRESEGTDSILYLKPFPILPLNFLRKPEFKTELGKKDLKTKFRPYFSYQLAPIFGRNIRTISGTFNPDSPTSSSLGERRVSLRKAGLCAGINYHFTNQFSLNTGFQITAGAFQSRWVFKYLYVEPNTNELRFSTNSGQVTTSDPTLIQNITNGITDIYQLRINHSFILYSIPVGITYRITQKKISPYFKTGINAEIFGKRSFSIDVYENGIIRNIEMNLNRPNSPIVFQGILALGVQGAMSKKWSLFSEAGYYVPLNNAFNLNGARVRNAGSSFMVGLNYTILRQD